MKSKNFQPRMFKTLPPQGSLPEVISLYMLNLINQTGGINGPLGKQFIAQPKKERKFFQKGIKDPLIEDEHEVMPGLIYKYKGKIDKKGKVVFFGRTLWTISRFCSTYCRFCTRGREVGLPANRSLKSGNTITQKPFLNDKEIKKVFHFLSQRKEINEVIISGGDPLVCPQKYLEKIINGLVKLQRQGQINIIRIGTRLPITNPVVIKNWHYQLLAKIKNPYLMVHINHKAELTPEALRAINNFRVKSLATIMSQSVLLKGVNDNEKTLYELFYKLTEEGIRPYYLFQNDPVYWAAHFTVPIKKAIKIWQKLRPKLSGIAATARFVIDTPFGFGKIPIPEGNAWKVNYRHFFDFKKRKHQLISF